MSSSPRYLVVGHAPRYGPRDERIGWISETLDTAETRAWAEHRCELLEEHYRGADLMLEIRDTTPEPVAYDLATADDTPLPF